MNVYRIDTNGESTWVCADTNIEALKKHQEITDIGLIDFDKEDEIVEIPKKDWKDLRIIQSDEDNYVTFEEYMKYVCNSDIIACTFF